MQNLAKSNSKMGDPESYNTKINEVNNRIQQQERRINQINNWLGEKPKSIEPGQFSFRLEYESIISEAIT